MIPDHIKQLALEAVVKTAIQGRLAQSPTGACLYTTEDGAHCGVGNALTPALQKEVGCAVCGVTLLCEKFPEVAKHLGVSLGPDGQTVEDNTLQLWRAVQKAHDSTMDSKPFGISWSRWFWSKARNRCAELGLDIGGFPRHLMKDMA